MVPESRVFRAAECENLVILACTVLDRSIRVMDGRTELRWLRCAIAVPAVACKNCNFLPPNFVSYDLALRHHLYQKVSWYRTQATETVLIINSNLQYLY